MKELYTGYAYSSFSGSIFAWKKDVFYVIISVIEQIIKKYSFFKIFIKIQKKGEKR